MTNVVTLLWVGLGTLVALGVAKLGAWCARRYRAASRTVDKLLDLSEQSHPVDYSGTPHCPVTPTTGKVVDCVTRDVPSDV